MVNTRVALLENAEELIRIRGYSGFSYADLAERVGIRKASIHHHFPAKHDLALALLASYDARYDAEMRGINDATRDGLSRIEAYGALYNQGVEKGLGCLCAAFATEYDVLPETLRTELARFFAKHVTWVETVVADGHRNGTIRISAPAKVYARMIVAAFEGALMIERTLGGTDGFGATMMAIEDALRPKPVY